MNSPPFYIVTFNRVSGLKHAMDYVQRASIEVRPTILDMGSTFEPFWEFANGLGVPIVDAGPRILNSTSNEKGHLLTKLWTSGFLGHLDEGPFFLSDGDLDYSDTSDTTFEELSALSNEFPWLPKVGCALRIDDLPGDEIGNQVRRWESWNWKVRWDTTSYLAAIDTTIAYYPARSNVFVLRPALRLANGNAVRHAPWYERSDNLSEEGKYYRERACSDLTHGSGQTLPDVKLERRYAYTAMAKFAIPFLKSPVSGPHVVRLLSRNAAVSPKDS